jgi:hypothetical protein
MHSANPRDVADQFLAVWRLRMSDLPLAQEYDMKRLRMDDMWSSLSPAMKEGVAEYFNRRVKELNYLLMIHRAVRTLISYSAEIDSDLSPPSSTQPPLMVASSEYQKE